MAGVDVKVGSFTLGASTGNQSITGLGFVPKLVLFWAYSLTSQAPSGTTANELRSSFGAASSATSRFCTSRSFLGGPYGYSSLHTKTTRVVEWFNAFSDAIAVAVDYVSHDADGFTVNVITTTSGVGIKYMAIGGASVSAKVGTFNTLAAAENTSQSITGVGFMPKALMVAFGPFTTNETLFFPGPSGLGFACGGVEASMSYNIYSEGTTEAFSRANLITERFIETISYGFSGGHESRAHFNTFDADGWTHTWAFSPSAASKWGYIALGGEAHYSLDLLLQRTTTGTQSVDTMDFTPSGVFFATVGGPRLAQDTSHVNAKWAIGAAGAGPSEVSDGLYMANGSTATTLPITSSSIDKSLIIPGTTAGSTLCEADMQSFNQDGFTLNWTKVNGVANEFIALSVGSIEPVSFTGNVQTRTQVTGNLTTDFNLNRALTVGCTMSADLYIEINFAAAIWNQCTVSGDLWTDPVLRCNMEGNTVMTGDITTQIALKEDLKNSFSMIADLTIFPYQPQSNVENEVVVTGDLTTEISLQALLSCPISMTADLTTLKPISATVSVGVEVLGNLTAPSDIIGMMPFDDWLEKDGAVRCILVETSAIIDGVPTNMYLSSRDFVTKNFELPANIAYESVLTGGIKVTEQLGLDSTQTISFGDIEVKNVDGSMDGWLDYVWKNRNIKVYIGDPAWLRSKFQLIFDGVISDIGSSSRERLNIKLRDKLERLNNPIHEEKLGGSTAEKDRLLPLAFGEVHNITPLLVDAPNHVYQVHAGPIESITEVRDNGVPLNVVATLADGKFRLTAAPVGAITCSLQGDKPSVYYNDVVSLIKRLVTSYGKVTDRFTDNEIDHPNFDAFQAANSQAIGTFVPDRANILQVCQEAAKSIGAQVCVSRLGKLQVKRIDLDFSSPEAGIFEIHPYHMYERKLSIADRTEVVAADKIGFAKNWTVQADLQTAIIEEHKSLYAQEWLTETVKRNDVATTYNLDTEPQQRDTMLISRTDAFVECNRRLDILSVPRHVYRFDGVPVLINLYLGQRVKLHHHRYGLQAGKYGVVVRLSPDWMTGAVQVDVMV